MADLDPITGKDPSSLTVAQLAERLAMERALREQAERFNGEALRTQATEYARRLDVLNHAHEAAVEAAAKTVPREMFDAYVKEATIREQSIVKTLTERMDIGLSTNRDKIDDLNGWRSGLEGRIVGITASIGIVVVIINVIIRFLP